MPPLAVLKAEPRLSEEDRAALARELANSIRGEVRFDLHNRLLYATDASLYQETPIGVVIPDGVDDAVEAIRFCARRGLAMLPRGGGTSLAGQCTNTAVVIDFSGGGSSRRILELDADARRCLVEPGITVDDLNDALSAHGVFFAPDPATTRQANIGGCIGNNAAGARSILYGRTSENVNGLHVALADGTTAHLFKGAAESDARVRELTLKVAQVVRDHERLIRERFPKTLRRNAGYGLDMILAQMDSAGPRADADEILRAINLSQLLCGSEGTLAVTLKADLKLHATPKAKGLALISFPTLDAGIEAVSPLLTLKPSAVEMVDDLILSLAEANTEYRRYAALMPRLPDGSAPKSVLYVEFFGGSAEEIRERFAALRAMLPRLGPTALAELTDSPGMLSAWKLRKAGEPLLHGIPGDRKPLTFVEDNAVPVEQLVPYVREFRKIVERHGTIASFWAHASVGVLHVRPLLDLRDATDQRHLREIAVEVADLVKSLGGVMSGEHGDGKVRGPLLERYFGPELMNAFRQVKAIFDPRNLLNPGNIVAPGPIESITERLRIKPLPGAQERQVEIPHEIETFFTYEDQGGFGHAVEMCNGAGVCRKTSGGTMCPSYMGTFDERHATRGRANALRLAITGQQRLDRPGGAGAPQFNDAETLKTLDLCLSCKACKSECPSNVDIARLKAEYVAQSHAVAGAPLSAKFFGYVRLVSYLASLTPGLANAVNRLKPVRAVLNRVLGLAPQRSIPTFAASLYRQWGSRQAPGRDAPKVTLFADCFTAYNDPHIGLAARRLLEAFGYRVELPKVGCCARAMISTGLLQDAVLEADRTLDLLAPSIEDDSVGAILVLEPSCLSAFKDDWVQLKLRAPMTVRKKLANKSMLVEEFLHRRWDQHPRRPEFDIARLGAVQLHGHCHQKALWGSETSGNLLGRVFGEKLRTLNTGCCGMAGSFGYMASKYELSMKIGELALFPQVRSAQEAARAAGAPMPAVVAPGTSCRHQIHDGVGVHAQHPVELLAACLKEP